MVGLPYHSRAGPAVLPSDPSSSTRLVRVSTPPPPSPRAADGGYRCPHQRDAKKATGLVVGVGR